MLKAGSWSKVTTMAFPVFCKKRGPRPLATGGVYVNFMPENETDLDNKAGINVDAEGARRPWRESDRVV